MPIKPENKKRYPKNWKEIRDQILERADYRCECVGECGSRYHMKATGNHFDGYLRCPAIDGEPHPITGSKVVLTVAHLDHTPENCDASNLKAMCQRCHLRYDMPHHKAEAAKTRRKRLADAGQTEFDALV